MFRECAAYGCPVALLLAAVLLGGCSDECQRVDLGPFPATRVPLSTGAAYGTTLGFVDVNLTCDVDIAGFSVWSATGGPYRTERREGCGRVAVLSYGILGGSGSLYDANRGSLIGWYAATDTQTTWPGTRCSDGAFVAGTWPAPTCAEDTSVLCRYGTCPHAVGNGYPATVANLVSLFTASQTLAEMDTGSVCDIDPASLPTPPTWPHGYVATRTEGCGVVTYELPFGSWQRFVVYSTLTGLPIGATSFDDIPAERETPTCTDQTVTAGTYPPPACAATVVRYCSSTPQMQHEAL